MKRQILQALISLLPMGMELHPKKLETMILKIEPEINNRKFTARELQKILNQFRTELEGDL